MNAESNKDPAQGSRSRIWMICAATVLALALLVFFAYLRTCRLVADSQRTTVDAVEQVGQAAANIAARLKSGSINTTFVAAIPRLVEEGTHLELTTLASTEVFSRTDERRILYDYIPLGTTVTEIRVPVTYRYHIRLSDPWHIEVNDQACIVQAPIIRPTLPPAIHTDRMEKHASAGWLRFNKAEQMEELQRSITPVLNSRAGNPDTIDLIRDRCRRNVASFIRNWLRLEDHWRSDGFRSITVVFADETDDPNTIGPSLVLEPGPAGND